MRVGYFGDGKWSHAALERIVLMPGIDVAFIVGRYRTPDKVLRETAKRLGIPFLTSADVNSREFMEQVSAYAPDLNVSMSFDQIFRPRLISAAPMGFINCHAGALPFYRGRNILNWALINGASSFGVTVHYVDEGIDTGDIILQRHIAIADDDDYASLLTKAVEACAELLPEAMMLLMQGTAPRIPQASIHPVGFYCGIRQAGDEVVDWNSSSRELHNFVRALVSPGPGARTFHNGREISILATGIIQDAPNYKDCPGRVVGCNAAGVVVKTADSTLLIKSMAWVSDGAPMEPFIPRFPIGTRFGQDPIVTLRRLEQRIAGFEQLCAGAGISTLDR